MDNKGFENNLGDIKTISKLDFNDVSEKSAEPFKYTYEEAISLIGTGKYHSFLLLVCGMCVLAFISETLGISILMVSARCDLHFSLYEQGLLASAGFLGVVISSHATGFLADTCGRKKLLQYTIALASTCSTISIFSPNFLMLVIMRFLVGVFMNGCQSCVFSYMGEFHGFKTKAKYITLLTIFFAIGGLYFPSIAIAVLPQEYNFYIGSIKFSSWRIMLLINSIPTFLAGLTMPFFPESPKFLLVQGKHDESLAILQKVYKLNTGKDKNTYPVQLITTDENSVKDLSKVKSLVEAISIIWAQTKPLFNRERRWITIILSICQFTVFFVCHGSLMWVPAIFKPLTDYSDSHLTICEAFRLYDTQNKIYNSINNSIDSECSPSKRVDIFVLQFITLLGVAFGILYLIFAIVIDIVGKRRLLLILMLFCGPAVLALIWTRGFILNTILLVCYLLFGNCAGLITSITVDYYPTNISGMAMCLVMMTGRLGSFVGSNVIGIILDQKCEYLFYTLTMMICCLIMLWSFLPKDKKVISIK